MFKFSHSTDGAGNSFMPRIKAKGKAKLTDGRKDLSGRICSLRYGCGLYERDDRLRPLARARTTRDAPLWQSPTQ